MTLYRTTLRVVVLSEEPLPEYVELHTIDTMTTCGVWVLGNYPEWPDVTSVEELTPEQMREALLDSDSSEDFFDDQERTTSD